MWIKKDPEELLLQEKILIKKLKKKRFLYSFWIFIAAFILGIISSVTYNLTGYDRLNPPSGGLESTEFVLSELTNDLTRIIVISSISFIITFLFYNRLFGKRIFTEMCDKCFDKRWNNRKLKYCKCGGEFIPLNYFKWTNN
jgi:hypothetical protein